MKAPDKEKRLEEAEYKAAYWLHLGNLACERGKPDLAERHYERAQAWFDRENELRYGATFHS